MNRWIAFVLILGLLVGPSQVALAGGAGPAVASALVPGLGQLINDDHHTGWGKLKIFTMWLIELGAIITTPILASSEGFPIVMVGAGIFAVNHFWSAWDAAKGGQESQEITTEGSDVR